MLNYSIIVPVYRGELTIAELSKQLTKFFNEQRLTFEIIFVYDCGPDNSWKKIIELKNELGDTIKAIKLSRNFGQHNAIICGFKYAAGEFVVTMDEDLQHSPSDILKLINKQKEENYDVVYGKYEELKHTSFRNITSVALKKLLELGIPELHKDYSAFRLMKNNVAKQLIEMNNSYTFLDGYLSWITGHVGSTIVSHKERIAGKSSYTVSKLINHAINIFATFSVLPIRLLTYSSLIIFLISLIYSFYIVVRKLIFNDLISGYASTIIVLGVGFGLTLLGLGILGEYIHRINLKTTKKPNFLESEVR